MLQDQPPCLQQPAQQPEQQPTSPGGRHDAATALLLFTTAPPLAHEGGSTPEQHAATYAEGEVPSTPFSRRKVTFDLPTTPRIYKYPRFRTDVQHSDDDAERGDDGIAAQAAAQELAAPSCRWVY